MLEQRKQVMVHKDTKVTRHYRDRGEIERGREEERVRTWG